MKEEQLFNSPDLDILIDAALSEKKIEGSPVTPVLHAVPSPQLSIGNSIKQVCDHLFDSRNLSANDRKHSIMLVQMLFAEQEKQIKKLKSELESEKAARMIAEANAKSLEKNIQDLTVRVQGQPRSSGSSDI